MPEVKSSDYDPLHTDLKSKNEVKPPVKPPEKRPPARRDEHSEEPKPSKLQVNMNKDGRKGVRTLPPQQQPKQISALPEITNPKTTIFIKNIPEYYNNVDALNKQLKKFGGIVNIKVDLKAKTTMIEFFKPKHARDALRSKQLLFGNKDIIMTGDMDAINEDNTKEAKVDTQLLEKLKFLIEVKKFTSEASKKAIVDKLNEVKQAQKTKEISEQLQEFLDYNTFEINVDHSQIIENVPDQYLTDKNKLSGRLEAIGKLESFKLNPKTKTLEFKFYNLESAKKAQETLSNELQIRFTSDKVNEFIEKVNEFEQKYLLGDPAKSSEANGGAGLQTEKMAAET